MGIDLVGWLNGPRSGRMGNWASIWSDRRTAGRTVGWTDGRSYGSRKLLVSNCKGSDALQKNVGYVNIYIYIYICECVPF